ncbi:hypothetical protein [Curtobacterium sp. MCJR17_043]|uniref:hypothetical protein n=1 Tax=Curtobacterium sp. MCJR17_043 TaxID=2175660 RepID=UPI0024DF79E9|nr:hypothetical protein [Curtobacterium sp. MCJR17_043]WIB35206.1 hypothetical protein DEJ15_12640 [Curtobacterium sp. MCJR17_043]
MDTARRGPRIIATVLAAAAVVAGLSGCTNAVRMEPAPAADAAACADAQVRLPAVVNDTLALRNTSAQATAAWGVPLRRALPLRCRRADRLRPAVLLAGLRGLDPRRPGGRRSSTRRSAGPPAVQVVIDTSRATGDALQDLGDAVSRLPEDGHRCLDPQDVD